MTTADVIASISALVAVLAAWSALLSARKANKAADRSAAADERSAAAAEEANRLAQVEADKYQAPWRLERIADGAYSLVNDSDSHEYLVQIDAVNGGFYVSPVAPQTVLKGSAISFRASIDYDSYSDSIQVVWHRREDGSDPRQTWYWPLPT